MCMYEPCFMLCCSIGMVFAFLTNEAIQDTVENVVPTVLSTMDNVGAFATDALNVRLHEISSVHHMVQDSHSNVQ